MIGPGVYPIKPLFKFVNDSYLLEGTLRKQIKYDEKVKALEENIGTLQTEIKLQEDEIIQSEEIEAVFRKEPTKVNDCDIIQNNIDSFFI